MATPGRATTHTIHLILLRGRKRLSTEGKIVSKFCKNSKILGRGSMKPTPALVPRWGCEFYVRGLKHHIYREEKTYKKSNLIIQ